jgi:hypothetical protein
MFHEVSYSAAHGRLMLISLNRDDPSELRTDYPTWNFGTIWTGAASGPDKRRIWARRTADGAFIVAWSASVLRARVEAEDAIPRV